MRIKPLLLTIILLLLLFFVVFAVFTMIGAGVCQIIGWPQNLTHQLVAGILAPPLVIFTGFPLWVLAYNLYTLMDEFFDKDMGAKPK
ncbi:hypothetical protein AB4090_13910 [Acidithiobacillus sp. IBUN Pt1247-S3]|uniref:hypothetical protein n=1 Tax=Acidithiobacillus sp. IBUN Pt1247-S3 TaxID=3166642 RepID=UPI0034E53466